MYKHADIDGCRKVKKINVEHQEINNVQHLALKQGKFCLF